jgi:hypothetical protein
MLLLNLAVGLPIMLLCLSLQVTATFFSVVYYLKTPYDAGYIAGLRPIVNAMLILIAGNFLQIIIWALTFMMLGEFNNIYDAAYHSAVNFSSLCYGDVVMGNKWKLLGPLEAGNGILMFGLTSSALMVILQQLIKAHPKLTKKQD